MEQQIFMSKLIPPTPTDYYLRRSSLMKKLSGWQQAKCTILHSSAGYGKTSLISQFIEDNDLPCAWYQITPDDDTIFPFFRHLIFSIQQHFPLFGEGLTGWDVNFKFLNSEELLQLTKQFVNELHKISKPFVIILEDYHHISHVFSINYVLNQIFYFLPKTVHIMIATRKMPEWDCLLHLRMNNQLIECLEYEFIFKEDDVQYLFEAHFGRALTEQECDFVMQMTEGWAMAVVLLAYQSKYSEQGLAEIAERSASNFSAYLSAEVFEKIEPNLQQDLLKLGIHEVISIDVLNDIYGVEWTESVQKNLLKMAFITPLADKTKYRFHALFQHFLQQRLREYYPQLFEHYHREAAHYYANVNLNVQAVSHAAQLANKHYLAELLIQFAPVFIKAGQFEYYLERLKLLTVAEKTYHLLYYEAECQRYRAQYEKSKLAYTECFVQAQLQQDTLFLMRAQFGLANIYLDTLQPVFAEYHLQQAIELLKYVEVSIEERQKINSCYTENLINLGRAGEAQRWSEKQQLSLEMNNVDARLNLRQGKLEEAKEMLFQRATKPFQWEEAHRTTGLLLVLIDVLMGQNEQAYERIIESDSDQLQDMPFTMALTKLRKGLALLNMETNNPELTKKCFDDTLTLMDQIHVKRVKAECYMGLILFYKSNVVEAKRYAQMGLKETNKVQDYWMSALLLTALAKVLAQNNLYQEAIDAAKQALMYYERSEDCYGQMVCAFWLAYSFMHLQQFDKAQQYYQMYAQSCQKTYPFFATNRTLFGPQHLLVIHEMHEYFTNEKLMESVPKKLLRIQLFGVVQTFRNQEPIYDKDWKRMKAKELFIYLYCHRHQFISKQQLCEAIWQHDDEAMARDFKVVYNAMLKALEPERSAREESHYIIKKQHLYKINTQWIESDVQLFDFYAQKGFEERLPKVSNEWLMLAMQFATAKFCEDIDREWALQLSVIYEEQVLKVIEKIAQNFVRLQRFDDVIHWAKRMLTFDVTHEEGYRLLMLSYYYLGNRREALKFYEKCTEVLQESYQLMPMESTEQLYDLIIKM